MDLTKKKDIIPSLSQRSKKQVGIVNNHWEWGKMEQLSVWRMEKAWNGCFDAEEVWSENNEKIVQLKKVQLKLRAKLLVTLSQP